MNKLYKVTTSRSDPGGFCGIEIYLVPCGKNDDPKEKLKSYLRIREPKQSYTFINNRTKVEELSINSITLLERRDGYMLL